MVPATGSFGGSVVTAVLVMCTELLLVIEVKTFSQPPGRSMAIPKDSNKSSQLFQVTVIAPTELSIFAERSYQIDSYYSVDDRTETL
ncbi:hypothetical protein BPOR_0238g00050 [Botrytis porri]|uniref:Uncharacterized protein n=1 Tax=Botrytis porri TaxID=87229 RepID=A0A4Z1KMF2_9HELO|nr:hypothetical protein BPOR_0238g00050 [Botrytis porri]